MPSTATRPIPTFYWVYFVVIDPLIACWGAYMNIFTPQVVVDAFIPASMSAYEPLQHFLQHQIAGGLLCCVVLDFLLLARTREIWIWKAQQYGQLLYDVIILWSTWYSLGQQGRLDWAKLRVEDLGGLAITGSCGIVRLLFVANFGLDSSEQKTKQK